MAGADYCKTAATTFFLLLQLLCFLSSGAQAGQVEKLRNCISQANTILQKLTSAPPVYHACKTNVKNAAADLRKALQLTLAAAKESSENEDSQRWIADQLVQSAFQNILGCIRPVPLAGPASYKVTHILIDLQNMLTPLQQYPMQQFYDNVNAAAQKDGIRTNNNVDENENSAQIEQENDNDAAADDFRDVNDDEDDASDDENLSKAVFSPRITLPPPAVKTEGMKGMPMWIRGWMSAPDSAPAPAPAPVVAPISVPVPDSAAPPSPVFKDEDGEVEVAAPISVPVPAPAENNNEESEEVEGLSPPPQDIRRRNSRFRIPRGSNDHPISLPFNFAFAYPRP